MSSLRDLCGQCVFAVFPGSSNILGGHQHSIPQGFDNLTCVADVCFLFRRGSWFGLAARDSVASTPALSLA